MPFYTIPQVAAQTGRTYDEVRHAVVQGKILGEKVVVGGIASRRPKSRKRPRKEEWHLDVKSTREWMKYNSR